LTRERIVAAAVQVLASEGLERVTMRRLAQELDTGAASLYVYVRNTAELHAAVLDELLARVDLKPVRARGQWRARLAKVLISYTQVLFEYPSLARSAMITRPSGPHYLNLLEALLALLGEGGVPDDRAAWGVDLLLQVATATAAEQGLRDQAIDAEAEQDALEQALRGVSPTSHPHIAALGPELLSGPGPVRLGWAFDALIDGVLHTARPT
jgi:AcrR family transcriptional regulator